MSEKTAAIVGSGIVGTAIAHHLVNRGYLVDVFEKGPQYPYPHAQPFTEKTRYRYDNPAYRLPRTIRDLEHSGDYAKDPDNERFMLVGGSATRWQALTIRMLPNDFRTKSLYRYGDDWPLGYADLEPYYCAAEALLGVSGTDADNPFAPPRSQPYPLPPFDLSYGDALIADKLRAAGIVLHTTPQARTRQAYDGRLPCQNFGMCSVCPIGARYSPNHHLAAAIGTGRCQLHTNTSVRRIILDGAGRAKALLCQQNDAATPTEHPAQVIVVACGAIESVRLLLLSADGPRRDGIGNDAGHLGKHFVFHHAWFGELHYGTSLYPARFGGPTGQSCQFLDPPGRGTHGGIKIEFSAASEYHKLREIRTVGNRAAIAEQLRPILHWHPIAMHSESVASPDKYVSLSQRRDRFGDPFPHVHYQSGEFDHATKRFALELFDRFASITGADERTFPETYSSASHHMGGCRMGLSVRDSVVDSYGRVHGTSNLFVAGGSTFVGTSGAVNPTLTMVALALRTADFIDHQVS
jgi:choline dehydrogenase-like flavoprotein